MRLAGIYYRAVKNTIQVQCTSKVHCTVYCTWINLPIALNIQLSQAAARVCEGNRSQIRYID